MFVLIYVSAIFLDLYDAQSLQVYLREACAKEAREAPCARLARGLRERLLARGLREAPCSRIARDLPEHLLARGSLREALCVNLARGLRECLGAELPAPISSPSTSHPRPGG